MTRTALVRLTGDLDAAAVLELRTEADVLLLDDAVAGLVVDLSETTCIEHHCLELLMHLKMLACDNAIPLELRAVPAAVRSALVAAGLDSVFDLATTPGGE